jgi:hypothetical protein
MDVKELGWGGLSLNFPKQFGPYLFLVKTGGLDQNQRS